MQQQERPRLPVWFIGAIAGALFWGAALTGAYAFEAFENLFPQWFLQRDLPDLLGSICSLIAAPVAIGGWLFIWGDNGPPFQWISSLVFKIAFGLCFYGFLGALLGVLCAKWLARKNRPGHCANCGYDMRGSTDCCPECGADRLTSTM